MNLSHLNTPQRQAVDLDKKNALVLAGAGSGKTRVLTHRIAYLCQQKKVSPLSILAVTFTNKAAQEMRGRIEELLGFSTYGMWIGTFHGIAHRLLRRHAVELGFDKNFKVLDSDDQLQMIKRVLASLNLDETYHPPKAIQSFINDKKDHGLRSVDVAKSYADATMLQIYQAYELRLKAENAFDFADLLLYSYELWLNHDILRKYYQSRFEYILVDEFQDTNTVQYQWLKALVTKDNCIMAVGDDDQSIYGWRGAKVENIERFVQEFSPVEVIRLEQNYRSTQTILNAANAVIANNDQRMGKSLWSDQAEGEPISIYEAFSERDEADFVVSKIKDIHANGTVPYQEIAILYRSNAQSRVLEEALLKQAIPYRIYGGVRFFERAEIKDTLAYMRLVAQPNDNLAFERALNTPARGIGAKTLETIRDYAREHERSLWTSSFALIEQKLLSARACTALKGFLDLIEDMIGVAAKLTLGQLMHYVIEHSGLMQALSDSRSEKSQQKVDNLKELVNAASEFVAPVEPVDEEDLLSEFLAFAVLESGEMQADENDDCVQMMTLHSAKGLEFPFVFITGLEEGLFPSSRSVDVVEKLNEERRLCYVGITRAMHKLHLSYATARYQYGDQLYPAVSRFLKEIPEEYTFKVRAKPQTIKPKVSFGISPFDFVQKTSGSPFRKGEAVSHPKFGVGVFVKAEGSGDEMQYHIDFAVGRKVLLAALAKLEKL